MEKSSSLKVNKKQKEMMHVYVLLFIMCIVVAILSYIIPAGEYAREVFDGRTIVVPDTYQVIESTPVSVWSLFNSVATGWSQAASIIFLVFMVGGAIKVIEDTGVIDKGLTRSMKLFEGREELVVILVSLLLSIIGATGTFSTANIAIVPITVAFAMKLGYDRVVAFSLAYLAVNTGFTAGWINVFTTKIPQDIAQLETFSGMGFRIIEHIVFFLIYAVFIIRYMRKYKQNPENSIAPFEEEDFKSQGTNLNEKFTIQEILAGIVAIASFIGLVYGASVLEFNTTEMSSVFFIMAVAGGILGGLGINGTAKSFANGLKGIAAGAFIVGMAKAISVVMVEGNIIDTVVYYLTMPISAVAPVIGANIMLLFNLVFNFFVSSGSGQAVAVMPIMTPISDLTGITRQVAVEAFKLGDGLSNIINPTAGAMMACLAIAKVPFTKYVKIILPYFFATVIAGMIFITIGQLIGLA